MKSILIVLSMFVCNLMVSQAAILCKATDIASGNVKNCDCDTMFAKCTKTCPNEMYSLNTCGDCGQANNYKCDTCDIYYSNLGVCGCLKELIKSGAGCVGGKPWTGSGNPPVWTLHKGGSLLISSTVLNTGVEELGKLSDKDGGWELGMNNMAHKTQALAMNSQHSRTHNQVHIHICPKHSAAETVLSGLDRGKYKNISPVPRSAAWPPNGVDVYCEVKDKPTPSSSVVNWLPSSSADKTRVGIGLLTDTNGHWWTCASVGGSAEHGVFCG
jgi:hypothetical protein